ncbi:M23 family metallopeptidase [Candidatus Methylospira mobilis]|uniref:M23 family metallopeptidase n=1 Tax=Candidatus Methylospira mobilis TaxID=1808979 RepID=A0A5Q0BJD4_9GAMM|nr:M23 family metallopeptidase [Candidatus Methylospira mobilis]QFY42268.1 M23 family metallopeptidase [Candidatus Methylospira mobilis]
MFRRRLSFLSSIATALAVLVLTSPIRLVNAKESGANGDRHKPEPRAILPVSDPLMISPLVWSVLAKPVYPVETTDGRIHLVYELNVNNNSRYTVNLDAVEVLDARTGLRTGLNQAISLDGQDIAGKIRPFSLENPSQNAVDYTNQLGPGQGGVIYYDLSYQIARDLPQSIKHRVVVSFQKADGTTQSLTSMDAGTEISREKALSISPPLEGAGWLIANGSGGIVTAHRYTAQPTNGALRSAEHFAIDFIKLDQSGKLHSGDQYNNSSYFCYGLNVLSATNGRVVVVSDGMTEQIPGRLVPPQEVLQYTGNHVVVAIGSGKYALYAHLVPGSVKVKQGDGVKAGQILGQFGSSGNSDAPHLHFQITNSASAFNTVGLPFVFERMRYQGRLKGELNPAIDSLFKGDGAEIDTSDAGLRSQQMPLTLDLIEFKCRVLAGVNSRLGFKLLFG